MYYTLSGSNLEKKEVGNKAYNLSVMVKNGLHVPEALLFPISSITEPNFQENFLQLAKDLEHLLPSSDGWAVRSSSLVEDTLESSMAGKFATVIISNPEQLLKAMSEVIESADKNALMGVIVQKFIEPNYAGVVFSCDPTTAEDDVVIEVVNGRGEQLVSGFITPRTYRKGKWENQGPDVSKEIMNEIIQTVERMKSLFGHDVDMEFCVKEDHLYWLQVRPVTATDNKTVVEQIDLSGEWFLLDQCTEPVTPFVQKLDPCGFFHMSLWDTIFVNQYPYIKMKQFTPNKSNDYTRLDILGEWNEIRQEFEPIFDQKLAENLDNLPIRILWEKVQERVRMNRQFVLRYMSRDWMMVRRKTGKKLRKLLQIALGEEVNIDSELSKLTAGLHTITARKAQLLDELIMEARQISDFQQLVDNFHKYSTHSWVKKFQCFIDEFGYELPYPVALHLATLGEKPEELLFKINHLLKSGYNPKQEDVSDGWRQYANNIERRLPIENRQEFNRQLQIYRDCLERTENDDYLLQKGASTVRMSILALGHQLWKNHQLFNTEDIFYLHPDEVEQLINGSLQVEFGQLERRKAAFLQAKKHLPVNMIKDGKVPDCEEGGIGSNVRLLNGKGVSRGKAEGHVFVIHNPLDRESYAQIPEKSVVIAPVLTPSLSYNLLSAVGVITEVGGFLSHGAIFAREMGIPAIVGVNSALQTLKNGDKVRLDADLGMIEIIP